MTKWQARLRQTNEVTTEVDLPDDVKPTERELTALVLKQIDDGVIRFIATESECDWWKGDR